MKKKLLLGAIATLGLLSLTGCGKSAEVDSKNILEMDEVKISAQEFFDDIKEDADIIEGKKFLERAGYEPLKSLFPDGVSAEDVAYTFINEDMQGLYSFHTLNQYY